MENWIITICLVNKRLESLVESYDRRIMKLALKTTGNCFFDCEKVANTMNNKNMLINLRILYEHIEQAIGVDGVEAIKHVITRDRIREYCEKNKLTRAGLIRKLKIAFSKAKTELINLSYDKTKFEKDYDQVSEVMALYTRVSSANWLRRVEQTCVKKNTNDVLFSSIIAKENSYTFAST